MAGELRCACGHQLYEHNSTRVPSSTHLTYVGCRECRCEQFTNDHGQRFYDGSLTEAVFA